MVRGYFISLSTPNLEKKKTSSVSEENVKILH